jgi:hypothetical protein
MPALAVFSATRACAVCCCLQVQAKYHDFFQAGKLARCAGLLCCVT